MAASSSSKPTKTPYEILVRKISQAQKKENKEGTPYYVNVSKITSKDVSKARLTNKISAKAIGIDGLNIISDTRQGYKTAVKILNAGSGQNYNDYLALWDQEEARLVRERKAERAANAKPRTPRAKKSPGAPKTPRAKKATAPKAKKPKTVRGTHDKAGRYVPGTPIDHEKLVAKFTKAYNRVNDENALNPDAPLKVVDVSNFHEDGRELKTRAIKNIDRIARGYAMASNGAIIPVVSDNYRGYKLAMDLLGSNEAREAVNEFRQVYGEQFITRESLKQVPVSTQDLGAIVQAYLDKVNKEGKWMDVSDLKPNGSGLRSTDAPASYEPKESSTRKWVPGSNIVSNNAASFRLATAAIGRTDLADWYEDAYGVGERRRATATGESFHGKPFPFTVDALTENAIYLPEYHEGAPLHKKRVRSPVVRVERRDWPASLARIPQASARSPGGSRLSPGGSRLSPGGSRLSPGGSRISPGGSRLSPGGSRISPGGSRISPGGSRLSPGGSRLSPGGSRISPGGSRLSPGGSRISPGGSRYPVIPPQPSPPAQARPQNGARLPALPGAGGRRLPTLPSLNRK